MTAAAQIVMPKLGLTMTEGVVVEWKAQPGQPVAEGDVLFVVETDKIANEVEAPRSGVIGEILVDIGATVPVGTVLARWRDEGAAPLPKPAAAQVSVARSPAPPPAPSAPAPQSGRHIATPLARRLARELGVDLATVRGSGPRGRIKAADVRHASTFAPEPRPVEPAPVPAGAAPVEALSGVQAAVARRMTTAKQEIPHFYLASEAEVGELLALQERLRALPDCPRLTLTHWLLAAVGRALAELPEFDKVWAEGGIRRLGETDVGVAVDGERGLFAPVLRGAGRLGVAQIAGRAEPLIERARAGRPLPEDGGGGALTVSNVGRHPVTYLTPIVNPGQAAILGVGRVRDVFRPDAEGKPVLNRELGLVLACDHRVLNGTDGAALLGRIVSLLEAPLRLVAPPV